MINKGVFYPTQNESCDFDVSWRRYGYFCNDTVIMIANKLHGFQCKFANVRMEERYEQNRININNID